MQIGICLAYNPRAQAFGSPWVEVVALDLALFDDLDLCSLEHGDCGDSIGLLELLESACTLIGVQICGGPALLGCHSPVALA